MLKTEETTMETAVLKRVSNLFIGCGVGSLLLWVTIGGGITVPVNAEAVGGLLAQLAISGFALYVIYRGIRGR